MGGDGSSLTTITAALGVEPSSLEDVKPVLESAGAVDAAENKKGQCSPADTCTGLAIAVVGDIIENDEASDAV